MNLEKLAEVTQRLVTLCREITDEHVVDQVLRPLQQAIALRVKKRRTTGWTNIASRVPEANAERKGTRRDGCGGSPGASTVLRRPAWDKSGPRSRQFMVILGLVIRQTSHEFDAHEFKRRGTSGCPQGATRVLELATRRGDYRSFTGELRSGNSLHGLS